MAPDFVAEPLLNVLCVCARACPYAAHVHAYRITLPLFCYSLGCLPLVVFGVGAHAHTYTHLIATTCPRRRILPAARAHR